jgi:polymorphic toxin system nucleotidyltransferase-like protein
VRDGAPGLVCYDVGVPEMSQISPDQFARIGARHSKLRLLLLFGSRARGDAQERSDWDLGYRPMKVSTRTRSRWIW